MRHVIYEIFPDQRLMLRIWYGRVPNSVVFETEREQFKHPHFPAAPKVIVDVSAAHMYELDDAGFRQFATIYAQYPEIAAGACVAIVATHQFERARKYERAVASLGVNVIAFNELWTACRWIGVPFRETAQWFAAAREELAKQVPSEVAS